MAEPTREQLIAAMFPGIARALELDCNPSWAMEWIELHQPEIHAVEALYAPLRAEAARLEAKNAELKTVGSLVERRLRLLAVVKAAERERDALRAVVVEKDAHIQIERERCCSPGGACLRCQARDVALALTPADVQVRAAAERRVIAWAAQQAPCDDWACAECHPNSDMLITGFQCAAHLAQRLIPTPARRDGDG